MSRTSRPSSGSYYFNLLSSRYQETQPQTQPSGVPSSPPPHAATPKPQPTAVRPQSDTYSRQSQSYASASQSQPDPYYAAQSKSSPSTIQSQTDPYAGRSNPYSSTTQPQSDPYVGRSKPYPSTTQSQSEPPYAGRSNPYSSTTQPQPDSYAARSNPYSSTTQPQSDSYAGRSNPYSSTTQPQSDPYAGRSNPYSSTTQPQSYPYAGRSKPYPSPTHPQSYHYADSSQSKSFTVETQAQYFATQPQAQPYSRSSKSQQTLPQPQIISPKTQPYVWQPETQTYVATSEAQLFPEVSKPQFNAVDPQTQRTPTKTQPYEWLPETQMYVKTSEAQLFPGVSKPQFNAVDPQTQRTPTKTQPYVWLPETQMYVKTSEAQLFPEVSKPKLNAVDPQTQRTPTKTQPYVWLPETQTYVKTPEAQLSAGLSRSQITPALPHPQLASPKIQPYAWQPQTQTFVATPQTKFSPGPSKHQLSSAVPQPPLESPQSTQPYQWRPQYQPTSVPPKVQPGAAPTQFKFYSGPPHTQPLVVSPQVQSFVVPPLNVNKSSYRTFQEEETRQDGRTLTRTTRTETRYSGEPETVDTSKNYSSNHWDEDRLHRNDDFEGDTAKQDIIHFTEMTSTKKVFESEPQAAPRRQVDIQGDILSAEGGVYESKPDVFHQWQNEPEGEEGVFENEPTRRPDVVREADTDITADLPPIGTAQSMRAKFMTVQQESTSQTRREVPPITRGSGGEYVTEPRDHVEKYQGRPESGVFESEPVHNPDVVRSGDELKEELPERGMAKNLANLFRQKSVENLHQASSSSRSKRDITPERTTKQVEYVSEPKSHQVQDFEVRVDAGVFENQPQRHADVVTSDSVPEDYIPERGFAKNVAARFRQMETTLKSPPPLSPGRRKEFTPPRQDDRSHQAVVVENHPEVKQDVVHSTDHLEDTLPEQGMAKNIAQLFRQMEADHKTSKSPTSPRAKKEFTPPTREFGVYENQPKQFQADYNRPSESGVIENQPVKRDDVVRGDEAPRYEEELPERGTAKNLVNRWRQMESESVKLKSPSSAGRPKDFTPPREEQRASFRKSQHSSVSSSHGHMDNGSVHPSDLPGQYQPQTEASVFESSPQNRPDLVREADSDWADGLPKKDTAKKMLAKFQSIQSEASRSTQGPPLRKDSESSEAEHFETMENDSLIVDDDDKVGRSKSMRAATQIEKCGACDKTVYAMERLEMNKRVYHKACFRCSQCKAILTPKTFAINNEIIFCTTHYKQLFATKGNYDEGFGRTQHKKLWSSNPNLVKDGE